MKVVRVGQPASIRDGLRHLSLAALAEATPEGQKVQKIFFDHSDSDLLAELGLLALCARKFCPCRVVLHELGRPLITRLTHCTPLQALHNRLLAQRLRERAASDVPVADLGKEEAWTAAESKAKQLEAGASKTLQEAEACVLDHAQVIGIFGHHTRLLMASQAQSGSLRHCCASGD